MINYSERKMAELCGKVFALFLLENARGPISVKQNSILSCLDEVFLIFKQNSGLIYGVIINTIRHKGCSTQSQLPIISTGQLCKSACLVSAADENIRIMSSDH